MDVRHIMGRIKQSTILIVNKFFVLTETWSSKQDLKIINLTFRCQGGVWYLDLKLGISRQGVQHLSSKKNFFCFFFYFIGDALEIRNACLTARL